MNKFQYLFFLLFFAFFGFELKAQQLLKFDSIFAAHLMQENLESERLAYYNTIDFSISDVTLPVKDIVHLTAKYRDSLLLRRYAPFANDTNDLITVFFGAIILNIKNLPQKLLSELNQKNISSSQLNQLFELLDYTDGVIHIEKTSNQFYSTTERIKKLQNKSLFIATLLSVLVPGSGKYYLLQNNEATGALILNLMVGLPLLELIIQYGLISTAALFSAVLFLPIYLANVYGTYISKKILLKKLKTQLKNEVLDYCTFQLHH